MARGALVMGTQSFQPRQSHSSTMPLCPCHFLRDEGCLLYFRFWVSFDLSISQCSWQVCLSCDEAFPCRRLNGQDWSPRKKRGTGFVPGVEGPIMGPLFVVPQARASLPHSRDGPELGQSRGRPKFSREKTIGNVGFGEAEGAVQAPSKGSASPSWRLGQMSHL